jgi:hypothetical protein
MPNFTKYFAETINYKLALPGKIIKSSTPIIKVTPCAESRCQPVFLYEYTLKQNLEKQYLGFCSNRNFNCIGWGKFWN